MWLVSCTGANGCDPWTRIKGHILWLFYGKFKMYLFNADCTWHQINSHKVILAIVCGRYTIKNIFSCEKSETRLLKCLCKETNVIASLSQWSSACNCARHTDTHTPTLIVVTNVFIPKRKIIWKGKGDVYWIIQENDLLLRLTHKNRC